MIYPSSPPAIVEEVKTGEGCTPTAAPELERLADKIANVSDTMDEVAYDRRPKPHNWWEVVEEEVDDKKGKESPRASKRMREPAAEKDAANAGRSPEPEVPPLVRELKVEVEGPGRAEDIASPAQAPARENPRRPKRR